MIKSKRSIFVYLVFTSALFGVAYAWIAPAPEGAAETMGSFREGMVAATFCFAALVALYLALHRSAGKR